MAYPSLQELLAAYQTQNPGAGPAIQSGTQGLVKGMELSQQARQQQALDKIRQWALEQKGQQGQEGIAIKEQQAQTAATKAATPPKQYQVAPGITAPEGKVAVMDQTTGKVEYQDLPGAKSNKDVTSGIADARIKMSLSNSLLQDPNYRKNQDIIDRGLRVENISTKKDLVDNPAAVHILNDLIVAQAEGGKASLAGVTKVGNETAQQFAARVMEKVTNEPESAKADAWIKQIKGISHQDMKSAYTSIDALARAKAQGLKRIYPDRATGIDDVANNFANDYITGIFGGKKPEFLQGGGAKGATTETSSTVTNTPSGVPGTTPIKTADDFLKKYGIK